MGTEYIWEVKVKNTPLIKRKCSQCSCDRFYCSDKFRMNSQKRNIDVWLIYRCVKCSNTYNMTLLSRTKPELIDKDLFAGFSENNRKLAWKYAFSSDVIQRNNVEADYNSVEYEVDFHQMSITDIAKIESESVTFKISTRFEFNLKLSSVIRSCLGLSDSQLKKLTEAGIIGIANTQSTKKHKVKDGDIVQINIEKLKKHLL